ncbi:MAG: ferrous iron transport protein B [Actinomycetota bacterium]|nr:MAG: ferrous iron transport protein B [Actinomycetota bacterium]
MSHCHGAPAAEADLGRAPVVLVGNSNVGKSAVFAALTGRRVNVSNYPGTTVEIASGTVRADGERTLIDTPGVRSTLPLSDDERVTRDALLDLEPSSVVQVIDAKNLRRGLLLTLELAETGLPVVLCLNMTDEAEARGIRVDAERLSRLLGVPVVPTVAVRRIGIDRLREALARAEPLARTVRFEDRIEEAVRRVGDLLPDDVAPRRALALGLLVGDPSLARRLELGPWGASALERIRTELETELGEPIAYALTRARLAEADRIVAEVVHRRRVSGRRLGEDLGRLAAHPLWGWPILVGVLVLMYLLVGVLGAGALVGLLEQRLFGEVVNPWATRVVRELVPWALLQRFLVGEYGLVTMALTYGFAIVLPIVATFFLAFGVLEDSGYLPRLGVMLDRAFRRIGLNGKAVLPLVLGLGCVTMATVSTRTLESRRERIQATLLLALAIPCSAQLGVMLGMVSITGPVGVAIWLAVVLGSLLAVGWLADRVLPGERSDFVLELPPMRRPGLGPVLTKTAARIEWYLREVIPVFVVGTAVLFALDETGLLARIEHALSPVVVSWLGLPAAATGVLLVGFLRRDYGAAGLFALATAGALSVRQTVVALVVITLFVPCIAALLMIVREHGWRVALAMLATVLAVVLVVGGALNLALGGLDVPLR